MSCVSIFRVHGVSHYLFYGFFGSMICVCFVVWVVLLWLLVFVVFFIFVFIFMMFCRIGLVFYAKYKNTYMGIFVICFCHFCNLCVEFDLIGAYGEFLEETGKES